MVGRAGAGALATVPKLNILHFNNLSLVVSGVSTALVTVLCTNHASMLIYAVVFGLSIGKRTFLRNYYMLLMYKTAVYTLVNGAITHQKPQI